MYGLAIATTVPSRPTITIPRATVTSVHHGLPRMGALVFGATSPSSTAVMLSHDALGRSPPGSRPSRSRRHHVAARRGRIELQSLRAGRAGPGGHLSRSTSAVLPVDAGAPSQGDGVPRALPHHDVLDSDGEHGLVTAPCSHLSSWIGQTALPAGGPRSD